MNKKLGSLICILTIIFFIELALSFVEISKKNKLDYAFSQVKNNPIRKAPINYYGYSDILNIADKGSNITLSNFKHSQDKKSSIIADINFNGEKEEFKKFLINVSKLDNIQSINTISVENDISSNENKRLSAVIEANFIKTK